MADHIHRTGAPMHDIVGVYGDPEVARGVASRIGDLGAVTGTTIGFVWGGGIGGAHEGSFQSLAAERGVTVSASVPSGLASEALRVMRDAQPIRLDLGTLEGNPVDTIATEEDIHR